VHVQRRGDGPGVLFLPGSGADHLGFGACARRLGERYTCWLFDPRGTGRTVGPAANLSVDLLAGDALALWAALGIERLALVGHSLGTRVALAVAARAPSRVAGMVLWAPWADADPFLDRQMALTRAAARALPPELAAEFLLWLLASPELQNREPARFAQMRDGMFPPGDVAAWQRALDYLDVGPRSRLDPASLAALPPTLVLGAEGDRMVPARYAKALFDALPTGAGHRFELLTGPRASHLAHVEMPDAFAAAVAGHLAGVATGGW
jgi:pimeloyl-ACP methyl ester carboxylesterase